MMLVKQALLGLGLAGLVTLLFWNTSGRDWAQHAQLVDRLRELKQVDATIDRDLLDSRHGTLNHYDSLVDGVARCQWLSKELGEQQAGQGRSSAALEALHGQLSATLAEQEELIEEYKSRFAVLRNSINYLPLAAALLSTDEVGLRNARLPEQVSTLLRDVLLYNLTAKPELVPIIRRQIEALQPEEPGFPDPVRARVKLLTRHVEIILVQKKAVDDLVARILALPIPQQSDALLAAYEADYQESLRLANLYRFGLYLFSVLLVGSMLHFMQQLRASNQAVQQANDQLEQRVSARTAELSTTNSQLALEVEERRAAEGRLQLARDMAEHANQTKSDFLAKMSHELRTPLNSVIGFANILLKNKAKNLREQDVVYLQRIQDNGNHLLCLINSVLDLSKVEAGRMELELSAVALDKLARETVALLENQVKNRDVRLVTELPATVALIDADAGKLKQVLLNLLSNALKFTEKGSVIVRVVTDPNTGRPRFLEVSDSGIGIPADRLEAIFEPFQQADNSTTRRYGGTGLGLTISRSFCELMGFRLQVSSVLGQGTTFRIVLGEQQANCASEEAPGPAVLTAPAWPTEATSPVQPDTPRYVLVIDDETDSRVLLSHCVEECGWNVLTASSAAQGLHLAREYRPDLITLDLMMPEMSGKDVFQQLQADPDLRSIPVVIVSIVAQDYRGKLPGVLEFLTKPVKREELARLLQRTLQPDRKTQTAPALTSV